MKKDSTSFRHWIITRDSDGTLQLILDQADRRINTLSREVLDELDRALEGIGRQPPSSLVLRSGKKNGFIAGADVTEFSGVSDFFEALSHVERAVAVFDRLERLQLPTVCVINGFCLGGGLELALACRYRVMIDSPETVLGMPEVKLGIHPGFGGTVRLIRRIGPMAAFDLMLTGRNIDARRALRIGLADCVVPERQWKQAVQMILQDAAPRKKHRFSDPLWRLRIFRFLLGRGLRRKIAGHVNEKHYPAPYALIDLWEGFGGDPSAMSREESRSVSNLIVGRTARNLVRVFHLRERLRGVGGGKERDFHSVHVIGAGTMGRDIAAWCALQGFRTTLQDVEKRQLADAVRRASLLFRAKLKEPRLVQAAHDRFIPDPNGEGVARADIVLEAIFEDVSAKGKLYQQVESKMRSDALLATNTSSIPLESLASFLKHPERFVGLHFFNPVAKMQLVEVVRGKGADVGKFERAAHFVSAIRRLPLPVSSSPGFLVNRLLTPYLLEAIIMEQEGISIEDIDRAAVEFGMPMGPILLSDTVGLDICLSVSRILSTSLSIDVPKRLETLVGIGRLGKKSGQGFYRYKSGGAVVSRKKGRNPRIEDIADRLILRLLNEAVACLRERIVSDSSLLDAGAVFGMGFAPFRGGPMNCIFTEGVESTLERLRTLERRYGRRFAPDPGWPQLNDLS